MAFRRAAESINSELDERFSRAQSVNGSGDATVFIRIFQGVTRGRVCVWQSQSPAKVQSALSSEASVNEVMGEGLKKRKKKKKKDLLP